MPCASKDEIDGFITNHQLQFWTIKSFVDYSQVDPGVGPVVQISKVVGTFDFSPSKLNTKNFEFVEH